MEWTPEGIYNMKSLTGEMKFMACCSHSIMKMRMKKLKVGHDYLDGFIDYNVSGNIAWLW
jgi:hypothetical protein